MPMRKVSEQDKGIRTLNQGRPRLCLSLTQFKRGDTSFEPGGTGTPAPPCLKIGKYRFSSAFTIKSIPAASGGLGSQNLRYAELFQSLSRFPYCHSAAEIRYSAAQ